MDNRALAQNHATVIKANLRDPALIAYFDEAMENLYIAGMTTALFLFLEEKKLAVGEASLIGESLLRILGAEDYYGLIDRHGGEKRQSATIKLAAGADRRRIVITVRYFPWGLHFILRGYTYGPIFEIKKAPSAIVAAANWLSDLSDSLKKIMAVLIALGVSAAPLGFLSTQKPTPTVPVETSQESPPMLLPKKNQL